MALAKALQACSTVVATTAETWTRLVVLLKIQEYPRSADGNFVAHVATVLLNQCCCMGCYYLRMHICW